ncbi:TetR/AcrR family transcriptional regulator [Agaribacterium haliotis]|uniref:TetR/AcrR family transcriptional regulator n=1 Tax=Agaribacterium haliotis TaxID=2013869 RepID=UPI000BB59C95|nr:TetR/AcrR family transcriptional regulator [Agaribacterium haliotis]
MKLSEQKKQAIVEAAIELFSEQGFARTRMDDIADRAGASKRTVYKHFSNKEHLFFHIVDLMMILFANENELNLEDLDEKSQLAALIRQQIDILCSEQMIRLSRVVLAATLNKDVDMTEVQARLNKPEAALRRWLEKQIADGFLAGKSAEEFELSILSTIKGRFFWPQLVGYMPAPSKQEKCNVINDIITFVTK